MWQLTSWYRHKQIGALNEQVERLRADYVRAEKEWKAAEINLSLQAVQHEKVVSDLRKEIGTLQEAAGLEETVTELRERNEEMEELMRSYSADQWYNVSLPLPSRTVQSRRRLWAGI